MQFERRRDGTSYIVEAYGADRQILERLRRTCPGSFVQWEAQGIPLLGSDSKPHMSPPVFVLWRPAAPVAALDELEDPAEFLADGDLSVPAPAAPEPPTPEPLLPASTSGGRRRPKSVQHKNITRVDRPERKMHGFHVRLGWKRRYYQKWFSDTTHGDGLGALAAAIAWRDAKERELGKPRTERTLKGQDITSNTGVVGVAQVTVKGKPYYRALWRDAAGHMHRRWFSVERLGESRALWAAIKAREEGLAELLGMQPSAST